MISRNMVWMHSTINKKSDYELRCLKKYVVMKKINFERCKEAAALCSTRTEYNRRFQKESEASRKNGWHDEICAHMSPPKHLYSKEECQATALLYENRGDFRKNSKKIYDKACHAGWLDEICEHMTGKTRKKAGWWNDIEHCKETALQYSTTKDLIANEESCYASIVRHKWTKVCCGHMKNRHKSYTNEDLAAIASFYDSYAEFHKNEINAYSVARKRGILEEICNHMTIKCRIQQKYDASFNYENCKEIASNYKNRTEWQQSINKRYYNYAYKMGWLDEICQHMVRVGNRKLRCIYVATFTDNCAYVGLTYNTCKRWKDHLRDDDSSVLLHIKETGLKPTFTKLTDYMPAEEAKVKEGVYESIYRQQGWTILNRATTGALGSTYGYSKDEVIKEALKYDSLTDFRLHSPGYYEAGYRSNYWNEIRLLCKAKTHLKYTEEDCRRISKRYKELKVFMKERSAVYQAARKFGIKDEICKHMKKRECISWNLETAKRYAKKCKSRSEFIKKYWGGYDILKKEGLLEEFFGKPKNKLWDEDSVRKEALKFDNRHDFATKAPKAYSAAVRLKILNLVCSHIKNPKEHECKSLDDAIAIAKKCTNRTEFKEEHNKAYEMLRKAGMLDGIAPDKCKKQPQKWTFERRKEAALKCGTRKEFKQKYPQAYDVARSKGELNSICSHMKFHRHKWNDKELIEILSHVHNMNELKEYHHFAWSHLKSNGFVGKYRKFFKDNNNE